MRSFNVIVIEGLILMSALSPLPAAELHPFILDGGKFGSFQKNTVVEVYGKTLKVTCAGLPAGTYTVELDATEYVFNQPGKRMMTVTCGDVELAKDLDLVKTVGKDKLFTIKGTVEHRGDPANGPLCISLQGPIGNAKFDAIRIRNEQGSVVAETTVRQMKADEDAFGSVVPKVEGPELWKDSHRTPEERATDLVRRMSLREKVAQIQMAAPAIPRLGIPAYHWWNECLHGVARAGTATVFPQAIAAAASWNPDLWQKAAAAMSDEARAKHHEYARTHHGDAAQYYGLDMWSPNVNIFRDPRWGRGHETYGEDPYLSGRMGVAFIQGLQGDDPTYIKVIATPKHYAVHSGPESQRHVFDAKASDQDLWETYLPAFEACFREGKACSIMGAYNRFRGESCSSSKLLLIDILRDTWGFKGYSVSDVDSVADIHATHHLKKDAAEAAAHALKNGMDLNSGSTYNALPQAVKRGLCTEADIDVAVKRCMIARIKLGFFDPPENVIYTKIPITVNDSPEHDALALKVAQESIVLLKNERKLLPLARTGKIAVIGPTANDGDVRDGRGVLVGNYNGTPSHRVTFLDGIQKKMNGKGTVLYSKGCELLSGKNPELTKEAMAMATQADVVVMVMGLSPVCEGEEGSGCGERTTLTLFPHQEALLQNVVALGKPVVLVLTGGSAIAVNWAKAHVPAILDVWYPGQRGGDALADVLFGDCNPAGRLPVTFYKTERDLPDFANYDMKGRTYRYFTGEPLFAFGYGLSYTTFNYSDLKTATDQSGTGSVSVKVKNTGTRAGDEVVQLYLNRQDADNSGLPLRSLRGFKRVALAQGEEKTIVFSLTPFQFALVNKNGIRTVEPGDYRLGLGGSQNAELSTTVKLSKRIVDPPYAHIPPQVMPGN
jgi:beta-glucosidase